MHGVAVVLAGGASRRMGASKARLEWHGQPLLVHVVERLQSHFGRVVVVGGDVQSLCPPGVLWLEDEQPGAGVAASICGALRRLQQPCFVCGCDMPFVHAGLGRWLLENGGGCAAHVPHWQGSPQPLHAAWFPETVNALQQKLSEGERTMWRILHSMDEMGAVRWAGEAEVRQFDADGQCFVNLNTPQDWAQWSARPERR